MEKSKPLPELQGFCIYLVILESARRWSGEDTVPYICVFCILKQKMPRKVLCCQCNITFMRLDGFSLKLSQAESSARSSLSADLAWCQQGVSRFTRCQCASVSSNTRTALVRVANSFVDQGTWAMTLLSLLWCLSPFCTKEFRESTA